MRRIKTFIPCIIALIVLIAEPNPETLDIFEPAMHNLFDTSSIVIDKILEGEL